MVTEIGIPGKQSQADREYSDLVRDRKIQGITDLRDESDRTGLRVVFEVRKDVDAEVVLKLFISIHAVRSEFWRYHACSGSRSSRSPYS